MSLMNDALRKKRTEKKHSSGADFLKPDAESKSKSNIKTYGLVIIGLLICAIGGFFGYEYYSLSRPIAPPQSSSPVTTTTLPPSQTEPTSEVKIIQETETQELAATAAPIEQKSVTPTTDVETKAQNQPLLKTESPLAANTEQKEAKPQPPATKAKIEPASRLTSSAPTPVIEPDGPVHTSQKSPATQAASPKNIASNQNKTDSIAERFYRKGLSYHRQNDLEKAIGMYLAARKKNPNHTATSFNLASAYIQVGAFAEAHHILTDLHVKDPDNPEVLLNMAVVELGLDRPEQALAFLDRAEIKFEQPRYEVLFHQGTAHSRLGDFTEALAYYQKAANIAPEKARLSLNIAIAFDNLTQYDQAVEYYLIFLDHYKNLDATEQYEIEKRVRELKAFLARNKASSTE